MKATYSQPTAKVVEINTHRPLCNVSEYDGASIESLSEDQFVW